MFKTESIWDRGDVNTHLFPEIRFFESFPHNLPNNIKGYIHASLFGLQSMNFDT